VNTLIGCSGTFDTIADIIDQVEPGEKQRQINEIPLTEFYRVHNLLVNSDRRQRLSIKGMDSVRVDLIVPAVVFTEHLIKQAGIAKIIHTGFSLREGVLYEMMESAGNAL
jgi:exopolyphosphatase/guanosine-5'-triphosphate,3'-diphosphate pyrophosphatase